MEWLSSKNKILIRWLYNEKQRIDEGFEVLEPTGWINPLFVKIKEKEVKESVLILKQKFGIGIRSDLLFSYEGCKRNKAILSLLWDLNTQASWIDIVKNQTYD